MEIVGGGTAARSRPMGEELPTSTPSSGPSSLGLTLHTRLEVFCPDEA